MKKDWVIATALGAYCILTGAMVHSKAKADNPHQGIAGQFARHLPNVLHTQVRIVGCEIINAFSDEQAPCAYILKSPEPTK